MSYASLKSLLIISLWSTLLVPFMLQAGSGDKQDLIGETTTQEILTGFPEFREEYESFQPTASEIQHMTQLTGKSLLVMFGSWCHDSEREVPRLMKLLDESKVQLEKLTFLAVDQTKQEPSGQAKANNLKYTPTIVLFDDNAEIGRIIERPNTSLANDLSGFVTD